LLAQEAALQQAAHQLLAQQSLIQLWRALAAVHRQVLPLALLQLLLVLLLLTMLLVVWRLHLQMLPQLVLLVAAGLCLLQHL
jgi:MFS superfamily sulfate permease-like transporter